jgi:hypothetical protein
MVRMGGMDGALLEGVMTSLGPVLQRPAADHGEAIINDWFRTGDLQSRRGRPPEVQLPEDLR